MPRSQIITVPPPYSPFGIVPSKSLYSMRVVLDLHRQPLDRRVEARPLGHGPALHHAVELEPEIEVQVTGGVLLDDEGQLLLARADRYRHVASWVFV